VDEDEVSNDECAENEVEMDSFGVEARKEDGECDGGEDDTGKEGWAMTMVEVVTGFEIFVAGWIGVEEAGVH
jgi:hypothetical protein